MKVNKLGITIATIILLAGCSPNTGTQNIDEIKQLIDSQNAQTAVIQLKNLLSDDPTNLEARYLLGKIYMNRGEADAAEKELRRAYKGGLLKDDLIPLYAKSLYMTDNLADLEDLAKGARTEDPVTLTSVTTYKALSQFKAGDNEQAAQSVQEANEISADSVYSILGSAHEAFYDARLDDSLNTVNLMIEQHPDFTDGYLLKGQIASLNKQFDVSAEALEKYIELQPEHIMGKFIYADTLIKAERYDDAQAHVSALLKIAPNHPYVNELQGVIHFNNKDYAETKLSMEKAIAAGSTSSMARLLGGVSSFNLGNLEQAHNHLSAISQKLEGDGTAKRLFAQIQLQLGYTDEAMNTLSTLEGVSMDDTRLFTQASHDLFLQGNKSQAQQLLDQAVQFEVNDPYELTRIGMLKLSMDDASGMVDLERALEENNNIAQAKWTLASAHLEQGNPVAAEKLAQEWITEEPENPLGYNLAATIAINQNKAAEGERYLSKALELDPGNPQALNYFADKTANAGDFAAAIKHMQALVSARPDFIDGQFKLFVMQHRNGTTQEGLAPLKASFEKHQDDILYRFNYARALMVAQRPTEVLKVLQGVEPSPTLPAFYWKAQADSYIVLRDVEGAFNVYEEWQKVQPKNKRAWMGTVVVRDLSKDYPNALAEVKQAQNEFPDDDVMRMLRIHYEFLDRNVYEAEKRYEALPQELKETAFAIGLKGQFHYIKGEFEEALPKFRTAYKAIPTGRTALFIANTYRNLNQPEYSNEILEQHLADYRADVNVRFKLADRYRDSKQGVKAIGHYKVLLEYVPENFVALDRKSVV